MITLMIVMIIRDNNVNGTDDGVGDFDDNDHCNFNDVGNDDDGDGPDYEAGDDVACKQAFHLSGAKRAAEKDRRAYSQGRGRWRRQ